MGARGARPGLSLFENRKKCSNFRKKQPDYVHLWVKMSYLKCNFKSIQEKWKIPCCTHEEQPHCGILENSCIWEFRKDTIASDLYRAILLKWIVAQVFEHVGITTSTMCHRILVQVIGNADDIRVLLVVRSFIASIDFCILEIKRWFQWLYYLFMTYEFL